MERVILVDEQDNPIGSEEKLRAHQDGGKLHRPFSVFIFNDHGELLLQRRARCKYHFGGLWSNTCCSHPRENETLSEAVHRKLVQEMGFDTAVEEALVFTYRADDANSGLTEHEFDHVFTGIHNAEESVRAGLLAQKQCCSAIGLIVSDLPTDERIVRPHECHP